MNHKKYIQRCIQIAKNGIGSSRPNPSVGAVIVLDNKIIGEGFTSEYGGNHAEVNAINSVKDISLLNKATLYVTLEPCSHFGKTPPCADLIVKHKIPNVVIGCLDSNSLVAGKGIKRLENAGTNVTVGVLEKECRAHHKRFFNAQEKDTPFIVLKWAETKNGFIAPLSKEKKEPVWISNSISKQLVHKIRSKEQAILVGTNTVIEDNPKLDVRTWGGYNPIKIIIDANLRIPKSSNIFNGDAKTIIFTKNKAEENNKNIIFEIIDFSKPIAIQICKVLQKHNIQSVLIEGGAKTLQTFIDENLWNEAFVFIGDKEFKGGIKSPKINSLNFTEQNIKTDILKIYTND